MRWLKLLLLLYSVSTALSTFTSNLVYKSKSERTYHAIALLPCFQRYRSNTFWGAVQESYGDIATFAYTICNSDAAIRATLETMFDKHFFDMEGDWNVIAYVSALSSNLNEIIANILDGKEVVFVLTNTSNPSFDISSVHKINSLSFENSFLKRSFVYPTLPTNIDLITYFITRFKWQSLVYIHFYKRDSQLKTYNETWTQLQMLNPTTCIEVYFIHMENKNKTKEIVRDIKMNPIKNVIFINSEVTRNILANFFDVLRQENIVNKTWFLNTENMQTANYKPLEQNNSLICYSMLSIAISSADKIKVKEERKYWSYYQFERYFLLQEVVPLVNVMPASVSFQEGIYKGYEQVKQTYLTYCANKTIRFDYDDIKFDPRKTTNPNPKCYKTNCQAGYEQEVNITEQGDLYTIIGWKCIPCNINTFKDQIGTQSCIPCSGVLIPNIDKTRCKDPYTNKFIKITDSSGVGIMILSGIGFVATLIILITFVRYSTTPIVKASNYILCIMQLLAHLFTFIAIPFVYLEEPNLLKCQSRNIICATTLTCICSITVIKVQKLLVIFQSKVILTEQRQAITTTIDVFVIILLNTVQIAIIVSSLVGNSPVVITKLNQSLMKRYYSCSTDGNLMYNFVYIIGLSIICSIQGMRARKLPSFFKETMSIIYAMLVTVVVLSLTFPMYYASSNFVVESTIHAIAVLLSNISIMIILFGYKTFVILLKSHKNNVKYFRRAMKEYVDTEVQSNMMKRSTARTTRACHSSSSLTTA